jgi:hypothetical protein
MRNEATRNSAANTRHIRKLGYIIDRVLERVLCRGYHGSATIEIVVRDGTIQEIEEHTIVRHRDGE